MAASGFGKCAGVRVEVQAGEVPASVGGLELGAVVLASRGATRIASDAAFAVALVTGYMAAGGGGGANGARENGGAFACAALTAAELSAGAKIGHATCGRVAGRYVAVDACAEPVDPGVGLTAAASVGFAWLGSAVELAGTCGGSVVAWFDLT